jgi:hypothetical protein
MKPTTAQFLKLMAASVLLVLALATSPAGATGLISECDIACNAQTSCDQGCYQSLPFFQMTTCGNYGSCEGSIRRELVAEAPAEGYFDCWSVCTYVYGSGLQSCNYTSDGRTLYVACIY